MKKDIAIKTETSDFKKEASKTLVALGVLALLIVAIAWPLASIWALNVLFDLTIEYSFWSWLACWVLIMTFQGAINIKREKTIRIKQ